MAKLIALVVLFAVVALALAAPAEEKKGEDLKTAQGIGLGFYGYPGFYGGYGGLGYGGLYGGYGLGLGYGGYGRGLYGHGFYG